MRRNNNGLRIFVALLIGAFSVISFLSSQEFNPVTGEKQFVSLTPRQEIALGLQSVPQMYQQFGQPVPDQEIQNYVDDVGFWLVNNSVAATTDWQFEFHVLDNDRTVNAFALPGGQIFITTALFNALETEGQLAGILAHEIVHVLGRHSSEQIAKQELSQGLIGAVAVASDQASSTQVAALVAQFVNMSYGREAELESDNLGLEIMADAGYDPRAMIEVMQILAAASSGARQPEFFSTHPNPGNRIAEIEAKINQMYPDGVPPDLTQ